MMSGSTMKAMMMVLTCYVAVQKVFPVFPVFSINMCFTNLLKMLRLKFI